MKKNVTEQDMCQVTRTESLITATQEHPASQTAMGDYSGHVYYCNLIISSQVPVADSI
jgi:hypothetical protein